MKNIFIKLSSILFMYAGVLVFLPTRANAFECGLSYSKTEIFECPAECPANEMANGRICCGWESDSGICLASRAANFPTSLNFDPKTGVTQENINAMNPLIIGNKNDRDTVADFSTPAGFINRALRYLFPLAGLILFVMLVWSGFEMLSTATTKKSIDAGRQRAQAAVIGFILLFASYWIIQIVEAIFSIKIISQ